MKDELDNTMDAPQETPTHEGTLPPTPVNTGKDAEKAPKHRFLGCMGLIFKLMGLLVISVLLIPVVIYLPPVQTWLKDAACRDVKEMTGMDVKIDRFRLKFPLDVSLQGVSVVEAQGDTMVRAREVIADVKVLPLLKLDVQLNKLSLNDGYYRMVSSDSSMVMKIRAGHLDVDPRSSFNVDSCRLVLNKAKLENADVEMYMDVWKQKKDTTKTDKPFDIRIGDLDAKNLRFAMSMLPTIDTLEFKTGELHLAKTHIDLASNKLTAGLLDAADGSFTFMVPTAKYIAEHPLPPDTLPQQDSPPFVIEGKRIGLHDFDVLYATKGVRPQPGFDASYIEVKNLDIVLNEFYNCGTTLRLPIESLTAQERSGLYIVSASGFVGLANEVLDLDGFHVVTADSRLDVDLQFPMAFMAPRSNARMKVKARGFVGMPDVNAFMPSLKKWTSLIPRGIPIVFDVNAAGNLNSVDIRQLNVKVSRVLELYAAGSARNPMDFKRLACNLKFKGRLMNPAVVDKFAPKLGIDLPTLSIDGHANIANNNYDAAFNLRTSAGDVTAAGKVNLNAETYNVKADIRNFDVWRFAPELGVGRVRAYIDAHGAGFNPIKPHAATDARVLVHSAVYKGHDYRNIDLTAHLDDGGFKVDLSSPDPYLDVDLKAAGKIAQDDYVFDVDADIRNVDLRALGLVKDSVFGGNARFTARGSAQPQKWLYDVDLDLEHVDVHIPGMDIVIPDAVTGYLKAYANSVDFKVDTRGTDVAFTSECGLKPLIDRVTRMMPAIERQIADRNLDIDSLQHHLPPFSLQLAAAGNGLISEFIDSTGISFDSIYANFSNDSIIRGFVGVNSVAKGDLVADTLTLTLKQRGKLMDYIAHMGNRPGTMDDFNKVDARGYFGENRVSLLLNQQNVEGVTDYRVGLTGAFQDSVISLHFTPLKSIIAGMPWTFNADNHIDLGPGRRVDANLIASSKESSILLETVDDPSGNLALHANLDNIKIEDFMNMTVFGPAISGTVNSDMKIVYRGNNFTGDGKLSVADLKYENTKIGNLDLNFGAALDIGGDTRAYVGLLMDEREVLKAYGILKQDESSMKPVNVGVQLIKFPLSVANAFLDKKTAVVSGALSGEMKMDGAMTDPKFNGKLMFDAADVYVPILGTKLKLDNEPVMVEDNVVKFGDFNIWGVNDKPLTLSGNVDARKFSDIRMDLSLKGDEFQVVGNKKTKGVDMYGKAYVSLDAYARGPLNRFDVGGNVKILNNTDVGYILSSAQAAIQQIGSDDVVQFVQFNDTTKVAEEETVKSSASMRINAALTIASGAKITVLLSNNGTDKVVLNPWGTLSYYQNYMGDMTLNGQLNLGTGFVQYTIPVLSRSVKFQLNDGSYVLWNGELMNPTLNINATDHMKVNVAQTGGNSSLVNFDVGLAVTNNLSHPNVVFDLNTNDDITIENQLQSMSADQRSSQAINLLLYGQYLGQGYESMGFNGESMLYGFLTSQINSWAANHIKGVDLSFGVNQYESGSSGNTQSATSYSYQVSKSLFDNKFKIVVGGNYSTDASADENFSQNILSDISFEYMLRQTNNQSIFFKLFRHTDFESVLEGEVTETGLGVVMKRRLNNLNELFNFLRPKRKKAETPQPANEK